MNNRKIFLPLLLLFILLNGFFLAGKSILDKYGIDQAVLIGGNLILFVATALSFFVSQRSLSAKNPNASVRSLYGSFMIKFFLIAIAAFIYIMSVKKNINKPALMICMGLYIVYTFIEVTSLQKMMKQKKNG
jgi:hypothetical protein